MPSPEPDEFAVLHTTDAIGCLANALRLGILRRLVEGPRTGSQVAEELGEPAQLVHYHLKRLLEHRLAREVAVPEDTKGRKSERYYRAVARHLFVDPALGCGDDATVRAVGAALEGAMDAWQRRHVFGVDLAAVAARVVGDCLDIQPGERVLLVAQPPVREIVEHLFVEVEARGGRPVVRPWSREYVYARLDRTPLERLASEPFAPLDELDSLDAVVLVSATQSAAAEPTPAQRERLPHLLRALGEWLRSVRERGVRYVELSVPARGDLVGGALPPSDAMGLYWRALAAPPAVLDAAAEALAAPVRAAADADGVAVLTLEDSHGGRLDVPVLAARPHWNVGRLTADDARAGRRAEELPPGSLAWLPAPGRAASGALTAPRLALHGAVWRDLELVLADGRLVDVRGEGAATLLSRLRAAGGDADRVAEVRAGVNAAAEGRSFGGGVPTGKTSLDAVLAGAVTLALGSNEILGGVQRASLDLRFPARVWRLRVGEVVLVCGEPSKGAVAGGVGLP
jgi:leucyl aminopeptidase (aminopeptidase T)/DNA-binding transcriptional ArsR family regulator